MQAFAKPGCYCECIGGVALGEIFPFPETKTKTFVPFTSRGQVLLVASCGETDIKNWQVPDRLGLAETSSAKKMRLLIKELLPAFEIIKVPSNNTGEIDDHSSMVAQVEVAEGQSPAGAEGTYIQSYDPNKIGWLDPADQCRIAIARNVLWGKTETGLYAPGLDSGAAAKPTIAATTA